MSRDRAARIEELFQRAADLPSDERASFLAEQTSGDEALFADVSALLVELDRGTSGILPSRPVRVAHSDEAAIPAAVDERFRLLRVLGEGGLGVVWLAEQITPLRRMVAIKLIKPGMDTRQVLARFEAERQVLALMDHQGIAHVYDAGVTRDGRPYFVMEYVPGAPLIGFCDAERLTTRERLELFVQACDAVHHAHRKGVIHRDIKPSNILVARIDERPVAKIIDFGIAKAITAPLEEHSIVTIEGQVIGTPAYMSPEQADGRPVDSTTDVYSLGVTLYEMLTGDLPFDPRTRFDRAVGGARQDSLAYGAVRPSSRIAALGAAAADRAGKRRTNPKPLAHALRGDLDWIVMKAIEVEPERRYSPASEFGADIRRHLAGETVGARPPGLRRETARFVRGHRVFVGVVAMAFVALAIGVAFAVATAHREARLRETAEWGGYRSDLVAAAAALAAGNATVARRVLHDAPPRYRDWEWRYLNWQCDRSLWTVRFDAPDSTWLTWRLDGQRLVGVSRDAILVRNVAGGGLLASHAPGLAQAWATASPDGRFVVLAGDGAAKAGSASAAYALWDVRTMSELWRNDGRAMIPDLPFASDASEIALTAPDSSRIFFVDAATGLERRSIALDRSRAPVFLGLSGGLAIFTDDDGAHAIDSTSGAVTWRSDERSITPGRLDSGRRYVLFFGLRQQRSRILDAQTGAVLGAPSRIDELHDAKPRDAGGVIALQSEGAEIVLVDAETEQEVVRLPGHAGTTIAGSRFVGDGSMLGSVSDAGEFKLWSASTSELPFRVVRGGFARAVHAATGRTAVSGWGLLQVWDAVLGTVAWSRLLSRENLGVAAFSPSGDALVLDPCGGPLLRLDARDGRTLAQLADPPGDATCLAWSQDGATVFAGADDGSVFVCDANAPSVTRVMRCHDSAVRVIAVSADGSRLATGSDARANGGTSRVSVWDARTGLLVRVIDARRPSAQASAVLCLAFDADGRRLAIGTFDGSCEIADVDEGRIAVSIPGEHSVTAVRFMGASRLAIGDRRARVHVHDAASGDRLLELEMSSDAIDFDGERLLSAGFSVPVCIAECAIPPCGYDARGLASRARSIVDALPREILLAPDVADATARMNLPDDVKHEAARYADLRGENANELNSEAWNIARKRDRPAAEFELALRLATRADAIWPHDWGILNTLATLQLRLGHDAEAIDAARRSDDIRERAGRGPHPANLAIVSMARWRRGEHEAARADLAAARALAANEPYASDRDATTFVDEAVALVAP